MKKKEATSLVNSLQKKSDLSIDDTISGFQLSLALGNHYQAIYFMELYESLIYEHFLDIALHIDKYIYCDRFINDSRKWKELYCEQKEILIAIMLHKKDNVSQWDKLLNILNEEYVTVNKVENSDLITKTIPELLELFHEAIERSESHKRSRILSDIGLSTNNLGLAKETLTHIREDREDLKNMILYNINKLLNCKTAEESPPTQSEGVVSYSEHEKDIDLILEALDKALENDLFTEEYYDDKILELAHNIASRYPIVAYNLQEKLHSNYSEELELQSKVSSVLFAVDIPKGVEYFQKIDIDIFKVTAIEHLVATSNDQEVFKALIECLEFIDYYIDKYEAMHALNKKIPISFEDIYEVSSQIMPYDDLNFEHDAISQYYRKKYNIKNKDKLKIVVVGIGSAGHAVVNILNKEAIGSHISTIKFTPNSEITRIVTVEELEKTRLTCIDGQNYVFGYIHNLWRALKSKMQDGDHLVEYKAVGSSGIRLMRGVDVIDDMITSIK